MSEEFEHYRICWQDEGCAPESGASFNGTRADADWLIAHLDKDPPTRRRWIETLPPKANPA